MKVTIAALAVLILVAPALAQGQKGAGPGPRDRAQQGQQRVLMQRPPEPATLSASGEGEVMVVPDIAIVTIGVDTRGTTAGEALAANSADLTNVIQTIRAAGVADKDIATAGFSVSPVYEQTPNNVRTDRPPKIIGYDVSNQVRVTIRDIAASGGILDKVVTAGANRVNGIAFDIADRQAAEDKAIAAAIAEARRRASIMAEAAGVKLMRITSVNANAGGGPRPVFARMEMAAAPVPVMPGEQSVTANASITWQVAEE